MSFYLAIERYLLTPLFDAKTMSIITDMSLENLRTGNGILNLEAHCDSFLRDMRYLQRHDWIRTNDLFRVKASIISIINNLQRRWRLPKDAEPRLS
jgi:hypothetical protein